MQLATMVRPCRSKKVWFFVLRRENFNRHLNPGLLIRRERGPVSGLKPATPCCSFQTSGGLAPKAAANRPQQNHHRGRAAAKPPPSVLISSASAAMLALPVCWHRACL